MSCTFSCTMKYLVRDCDPNTGEPDDDGYDDEYVVRETRKGREVNFPARLPQH